MVETMVSYASIPQTKSEFPRRQPFSFSGGFKVSQMSSKARSCRHYDVLPAISLEGMLVEVLATDIEDRENALNKVDAIIAILN